MPVILAQERQSQRESASERAREREGETERQRDRERDLRDIDRVCLVARLFGRQ